MKYLSIILVFLETLVWAKDLHQHLHRGGYNVGSQEAQPGQFPWQAYLILALTDDMWILCGGSLISVEWVLTAAFCVDSDYPASVVLSGLRIDQTSPSEQVIKSTEIIIHEHWDPETGVNDIALIRLKPPAKLNPNVQVINLGHNEVEPFTDVVASGWGFSEEFGNMSAKLRYVTLKVISPGKCWEHFEVPQLKNIVCASGKGSKPICLSDTGSPLMEYKQKVPVLVGIASFISDMGCSEGPMVFTQISKYIRWIRRKTGVATP